MKGGHQAAQSRQASREPGKRQALEETIKLVETKLGRGILMRMGDATARMTVETVPTGSIGLDLALGIGGVPRGRVSEIFGPEASGKSTLALHLVAEAQKTGGLAVYVDSEHALDPAYAGSCGVDIENLLISQPDSGEQALDVVDAVVRSGTIDIVVIDSVAALVPKAELDGDMGDPHVGRQARLMSQALRKLVASVSRERTAVVFLNQLREKVGVVYGNPEVTTGGRALKFYSSVRVDLRRIEAVKDGDDLVGSRVRARVVKNKVAPPFRSAEFDIIFGQGISREGELLDIGTRLGMVKEQAGFYSWAETQLGRGRNAARLFLKQHPEVAQHIEEEVRLHLRRDGGGVRMIKDLGATVEPAQDDLLADEVRDDDGV